MPFVSPNEPPSLLFKQLMTRNCHFEELPGLKTKSKHHKRETHSATCVSYFYICYNSDILKTWKIAEQL